MDYDDHFNRYMSSVTSSREIVRSLLTLLERQDEQLHLMYLNWSASQQQQAVSQQQQAASPAQQRRRTGLGTYDHVNRTATQYTMQYPLSTRFNREYLQFFNNTHANQDIDDNTLDNIIAQALLNSVGNLGGMIPVVVRPSQRTVELATDNILFSEIPSNIDRYQQCPISHDIFQANTPITRIRHCGHYFEREAIATWFQTSCICPICRSDIRDGVTDNSDHNEEIVDEPDISVGSADDVANNSDHN